MEGDHIKIYDWLLPFSWLYGLGVAIRNALFDFGIIKSKSYHVPVICVGNITVGGTGKTPHTEYLIDLLKDDNQVAILSRGYKRKTSGYVLSTTNTAMHEIGDEPYQMKRKYPSVHVAVDKNRCHGIERLISDDVVPHTDVIILDDAYQHRYVTPGINILLMDYHRLIYFDRLLPAGRLREPTKGKYRADIVIITKCPPYITPMDKRGIERSLELKNWQQVFFSTFAYGTPYGLIDRKEKTIDELKQKDIVLLTGIASPQQMIYDLKKIIPEFDVISFPDHHNFTSQDIKDIITRSEGKTILTTEKDASRLLDIGEEALGKYIINNTYVLPIKVEFMGNGKERFDEIIKSYVLKNSRKSILSKNKKQHAKN